MHYKQLNVNTIIICCCSLVRLTKLFICVTGIGHVEHKHNYCSDNNVIVVARSIITEYFLNQVVYSPSCTSKFDMVDYWNCIRPPRVCMRDCVTFNSNGSPSSTDDAILKTSF